MGSSQFVYLRLGDLIEEREEIQQYLMAMGRPVCGKSVTVLQLTAQEIEDIAALNLNTSASDFDWIANTSGVVAEIAQNAERLREIELVRAIRRAFDFSRPRLASSCAASVRRKPAVSLFSPPSTGI